MAPSHLEFLAKRLQLGFYPKGSVIAEPKSGPAQSFFIIKQGRVRGETSNGSSDDGAWELVAGESFPIGALLARRPVVTLHRAVEDTFCFELERQEFDKLLVLSPVFHDFCSRRLANLLDQALRGVKGDLASAVSGDAALSIPIARLMRRAPVSCRPETRLGDALTIMHAEHVGSIIVVDDQARPQGVFTLHDLLALVSAGRPLHVPISDVMTAWVHALHGQATAHEAAMLMARQAIGHVCIVEGGRLIGVVSERDLFSLQRVGLVHLTRTITRAPDQSALKQASRDLHNLIDQMLVQGASVGQLTQIITLLNDHITRRVIELCLNESGPGLPFTWLSFGSEGRHEQTLKTDQDNGILFSTPPGRSAEGVRAQLLPLAGRINRALADIGYPFCPGNVMASNVECCLSAEEWQERFAGWIDQGGPAQLLKASIYFDFRPLFGDEAPADQLHRFVAERIAANPRFLRQMAENMLRNTPPLGLVREFVLESDGEHANTLDLKLRGTSPFVDCARLLALANNISETNTIARLQSAARAGVLSENEAAAWCDAYAFIQLLRMRSHQEQEKAAKPLNNRIDPDRLNELDRRILKESFRQARKLQTRVALDYQL